MGDFIGKFLEYDGTNLGHSDSFCQAKIGFEVAKMEWDLSLRAQSRRALTMNNVWLRGEGNLDVEGIQSNLQRRVDMDQDSTMCVMEGGDGKKWPRRESDKFMKGEDVGSLV
ncbi:hypothetical protein Gotri_001225, partial [Gossypium trilobum]|nr:hypothetical protein [Gossypium trilobum]